MVVQGALSYLFKLDYPSKIYGKGRNSWKRIDYDAKPSISFRDGLLSKDHTYVVIFNKDQQHGKEIYEYLVSFPGITVVYQSKPAVNRVPNHGKTPRNFVVIFEYEDPVQAVPEMQSAG